MTTQEIIARARKEAKTVSADKLQVIRVAWDQCLKSELTADPGLEIVEFTVTGYEEDVLKQFFTQLRTEKCKIGRIRTHEYQSERYGGDGYNTETYRQVSIALP